MLELTISLVLEHLEDAVLELGLLLFGEEAVQNPYEEFLLRTRELEAASLAAMGAEEVLREEPDCRKCVKKITGLFSKIPPAKAPPISQELEQSTYEPGSLLALYQNLTRAMLELEAVGGGKNRCQDAAAAFRREHPYAGIYAEIGAELRGILLRCKAQPEEFCRQAAALYSRYQPDIDAMFPGARVSQQGDG